MTHALSRFGPPLALMGLIFYLSAQPDVGPDLGTFDLILRKCAHALEYGVLYVLWARALGQPLPAIAISLLYAASDEFHQTFVDGRHGTPVDVGIDAIGMAIAYRLYSQPRSVA